jgi:hypothetical protein
MLRRGSGIAVLRHTPLLPRSSQIHSSLELKSSNSLSFTSITPFPCGCYGCGYPGLGVNERQQGGTLRGISTPLFAGDFHPLQLTPRDLDHRHSAQQTFHLQVLRPQIATQPLHLFAPLETRHDSKSKPQPPNISKSAKNAPRRNGSRRAHVAAARPGRRE